MDAPPSYHAGRTLLEELIAHDEIFSLCLGKRNKGCDLLCAGPLRVCLDRDWRKAVFHLLNNAAKSLQISVSYEDLEEDRFCMKLFPVRFKTDVCNNLNSPLPHDYSFTGTTFGICMMLSTLGMVQVKAGTQKKVSIIMSFTNTVYCDVLTLLPSKSSQALL